MAAGRCREQNPELAGAWRSRVEETADRILVVLEKQTAGILCRKAVTFGRERQFSAEYVWRNESGEPRELRPAVEFNFGLLSSGFGRHCQGTGSALSTERLDVPAEDRELTGLTVIDEHRHIGIVFGLSRPADLWRYPVETVSQSESGLERNYQCSCFLWHRQLRLEPGQEESLRINIEYRETP